MFNSLPDDIINYIYEFADPEITWVQTKIQNLNVNDSGWIMSENKHNERPTHKLHCLNILRAMKEIPLIVIPAKTVTMSSYGLKHDLEYHRHLIKSPDYYISNGEFICSMILLGFKYKKPDSLNVSFYVKKNKSSAVWSRY